MHLNYSISLTNYGVPLVPRLRLSAASPRLRIAPAVGFPLQSLTQTYKQKIKRNKHFHFLTASNQLHKIEKTPNNEHAT
jgi:hypothetical protein